MSACFIYVVEIDGNPICKVGISANPSSRLSQLLTGSPFDMTMVHRFRMPDRATAYEIEQEFHRSHADRRLRGEWFRMSAQDATCHIMMSIVCRVDAAMGSDDLVAQGRMLYAIGMPGWFWDRARGQGAWHPSDEGLQ